MLDWAEKYRPKSLPEVAGNPAATGQLESWASAWEKGAPKKRAVILAGNPGIGKTSAAHALAHDFGWGVVEMNASDTRNAAAVKDVAMRGALYETFTANGDFIRHHEGGRKLIILDEADNLFGREDYGGAGAIADTIRSTQQPIALIVNDLYELTRRSSAFKRLSEVIRFRKPRPETVAKILRQISQAEGVDVEEEVLSFISERSQGDIRSAINDLQSLAVGTEVVREKDLLALGYRDERKEVFEALGTIFRSGSVEDSRRSVMDLDEDPERLILWVDENIPYEYRDPADLEKGLGWLARADEYLGHVRRWQQYILWRYASDLMAGGVATARKESFAGGQYRFPLWLAKMSRTRSLRSTMDSILGKIGRHGYMSRRATRERLYPAFKFLFRNSEEFRVSQALGLELAANEIALILGEKEDSNAVKRVLKAMEGIRSLGAQVAPFSRFEP